MEVPQSRNRIFFIANNQNYSKLKLNFQYPVIKFGEIRTRHGKSFTTQEGGKYQELLKLARPSDKDISDVRKRFDGKGGGFTHIIVTDEDICPCITASGHNFRLYDRLRFSDGDYINVQTFPQDYDFCGQNVQYVCGMSVPPNMMAHIALEIWNHWNQWLNEQR